MNKTPEQINKDIFRLTKQVYCEDSDEVKAISLGYNACVSQAGRALHRRSFIVDTCTFYLEDYGWHLEESGATAINCTVPRARDSAGEAMLNIAGYYNVILEDPEHFLLVKTVDDIVKAKQEGKVGVIIGSQTCDFINHHDIFASVEVFHRLGLRVMQISYNHHSFAADGCQTGARGGLTREGRQLIRAMEHHGLTVDLSHVSERSTLEAMEYAEKPVIFSHANPMGMYKHIRNITDEQAKKCAATGGVVGVSAYTPTLWDGEHFPTVETVVDCICYNVDLLGIDHVGIGIDSNATAGAYDYSEIAPVAKYLNIGGKKDGLSYKSYMAGRGVKGLFVDGIESLANWPNLADHLLKRGFSEAECRKLMGENWMRVFRETWK